MSDVYARWARRMEGADRPAGTALGGWAFGDVLAAGHGRLRVVCGGLTLEAAMLHVPPELIYTWDEDRGQSNYLRVGDRLLILVTEDRQDYYIVEKSRW